ncbi:Mv-ORF61 peptide [Maruca vitrata nucleopolyhedrovirus]|uniref:Mv-ORF61 peptide n=1 Tax=Maruca vitrata nucleopolyhedrovirus TaxID=1307954 RepID=A1YRC3_9ABAC|nr:Mv-ORF61 peptide [Maruca vitrata nucleopolyhedrovirus]ABL76013.1 Mv-ORF61 peptide [Maruca vitrata nucleopolyhedrovirus]
MNLDVPYYRLGSHEKVEYIPLKLALNDDETANEPQQFNEPPKNDMMGYDNATSNMSAGIIILISVVAFVALFLLLYVIYYFVILREQQQYLDNIDTNSPFVFNKFD